MKAQQAPTAVADLSARQASRLRRSTTASMNTQSRIGGTIQSDEQRSPTSVSTVLPSDENRLRAQPADRRRLSSRRRQRLGGLAAQIDVSTRLIAYRSTSATRRLNQFMKSEITRLMAR